MYMRKFFRKTGYGILTAGVAAMMSCGMPVFASEQQTGDVQDTAGVELVEDAQDVADVELVEGAQDVAGVELVEDAQNVVAEGETEDGQNANEEAQTENLQISAGTLSAQAMRSPCDSSVTMDDEEPVTEEGFVTGADGEIYYIDAEGVVLTDQMITVAEKDYYLTSTGAMLRSAAVLWDGVLYRANKYGVLSVKSGWVQAGVDWYYSKEDGTPRTDEWISGKYYVDGNGCMVTDDIIYWEGQFYYVDANGVWVSELGWLKFQKNWYYINQYGSLEVDSIITDDRKLYYLDETGRMVTKTIVYVEDEWYYYAGANGAFREKEGWIECDGEWYYLEADGRVRCNATAMDARGKRFYLGDDGKMVKNEIVVLDEVMFWAGKDGAFRAREGWLQIGDNWYYTEADGSFRRNAFVKTSAKKQYYMNDVGKMVVSTIIMYQDKLYYFDKNGLVKMNTGWMKINERWYYAIGGGELMRNQILEYKDQLYYMGDDGHMIFSDGVVTKGKGYLADAEGVLTPTTGWFMSGGLWYRADKNSTIIKDRYITVGGKEYYLDYDGVMQDNCFFYDGDNLMYAKKGGQVRRQGGWMQLGERWFFSKTNGVFYRGVSVKIKGVRYYFNEDGSMRDAPDYYYPGYIEDTSYVEINGRRYHVDANGNVDSWFGIDVSGYQDIIDWDKVKADGVDFAFIRVGGRFKASGLIYDDSKAIRNLMEANRVGIPVGVYFFSQAMTVEEAIEEADYTLSVIQGYDVQLPVVIDTENSEGGRQNALTPQERTNNMKAFCERVAAAGYTPMYYAGMGYCVDGYVLYEQLSEYMHWCAQYWIRNQCDDFGVPYQIWQYSEKGKIDGIYGGVDCNIWYRNY